MQDPLGALQGSKSEIAPIRVAPGCLSAPCGPEKRRADPSLRVAGLEVEDVPGPGAFITPGDLSSGKKVCDSSTQASALVIYPIQFARRSLETRHNTWHDDCLATLALLFGPQENVIPMPVHQENERPCDSPLDT